VIRAATQGAPLFVRRTKRKVWRLLELERVVDLLSRLPVGERPRHPNGLQRLLLDVVRLFRIERKNLERDVGLGDQQADDALRTELPHRLQAMVAVRRPVAAVVPNHHDRIEKATDLLDDGHQALDMGV